MHTISKDKNRSNYHLPIRTRLNLSDLSLKTAVKMPSPAIETAAFTTVFLSLCYRCLPLTSEAMLDYTGKRQMGGADVQPQLMIVA